MSCEPGYRPPPPPPELMHDIVDGTNTYQNTVHNAVLDVVGAAESLARKYDERGGAACMCKICSMVRRLHTISNCSRIVP